MADEDRLNRAYDVLCFPLLRQKKGAKMGRGAFTKRLAKNTVD
jgi:hypothetical protein